MPSKKLMAVWTVLNFALLGAGIFSIVISVLWRRPDLLRDLVISKSDLTAGIVIGVVFIVTWAVSVTGIIQRNHITYPLKVLNWLLILCALVVTIIGTIIWFYTLREMSNFHKVFAAQSNETRILVQDHFQCCGYFNANDLLVQGGTICVPPFSKNTTLCSLPITSFADYTLNNVFTSVYGFMAIVLGLFLATLCVINKRVEEERFRKIDEKRGGRGFV